jgi:hypothetical protein
MVSGSLGVWAAAGRATILPNSARERHGPR